VEFAHGKKGGGEGTVSNGTRGERRKGKTRSEERK